MLVFRLKYVCVIWEIEEEIRLSQDCFRLRVDLIKFQLV